MNVNIQTSSLHANADQAASSDSFLRGLGRALAKLCAHENRSTSSLALTLRLSPEHLRRARIGDGEAQLGMERDDSKSLLDPNTPGCPPAGDHQVLRFGRN